MWLVFFLGVLSASGAADVVPGEECAPWEHWEGGHGGSCKFGCSVGAVGSDDAPTAPLLGGALLLGWLGVRRSRRNR